MNIHERMEGLVDVVVAGGLGAAERVEVEQHVASCAACASLLRDAREFSTWAKVAIAADAPPADLEERVVERFRAAGQSKKRRFIVGKRVLKVTGSIAAAIALIFLGNLFSAQGQVSASLKNMESAEADFRANDRDWNHANDFWTGDVAGLYAMTSADLGKSGGRGAEKLTEGETRSRSLTGWWDQSLGYVDKAKAATEAPLALGLVMQRESSRNEKQLADRLSETSQQHTGGKVFAAKGNRQDVLKGVDEIESLRIRGSVDSGKPVPNTLVQDNRKIIRTADVSIEVDSYEATSTKLTGIVTAEKGFVSNSNTQKMANGKIQGTVIVRVPPERFDAVLARLKELGTIRNQSVGSEDVTKVYVDLESRLLSKQTLADRLRKLLSEGKGTVKELMEVEVQLGNTNEAVERIKGEMKYYDNRIGLSTLTLQIAEKDLGQPFEYVQTLNANLALTARDPDDAYAKAQKEISAVGGQIVDSRMSRQNDGSSTGTIRARVEADKFSALRESLRKLGFPTNDTVNQQKSARGGQEGTPKPDAPLRKELAVLDLSISSPPLFVTDKSQLLIETPAVESAYQNSRKVIEAAGGKIVDGALAGRGERLSGSLRAQVDADKFTALVESLKTAGTLKNANVNHLLPTVTPEGVPLLRERAEIELTLVSPPQLIADENGLGKTIRETFSNSWAGVLWSVEKLFVGISLAGPWLLLLGAGVFLWRRLRRSKAKA